MSRARPGRRRSSLAQSEDGDQCLIDPPLLLWGNPADQFAEAARVNRADLLYQDAGAFAEQVYLRAKGSGSCAAGSRCYEDN